MNRGYSTSVVNTANFVHYQNRKAETRKAQAQAKADIEAAYPSTMSSSSTATSSYDGASVRSSNSSVSSVFKAKVAAHKAAKQEKKDRQLAEKLAKQQQQPTQKQKPTLASCVNLNMPASRY